MALQTLVFPNGDTPLDLLLYARLRREVDGLVEATLAANPGLPALGPYPPAGTIIVVDVPAPSSPSSPAPVVRLYE